MNKASLFASAAVASLALGAAPAFAQAGGPFADVPTDHWAYSAVDTLQKAGIVIGYPDQTYGGKRPMTRYEFAVAIARLLGKMNTPAAPPDLSKYVTKDDLASALTPYALKSDLAGFAKQSDLDALRRLVSEFQTELTTLGVDLDAVKRRLDALEGRVRALEIEQKRVQIGGAINLMGRGNYSTDNSKSVTDADGYQIANGSRQNVFGDAYVLHDIDLKVKARLSDTATAETVINFGNYLSYIGSVGSYTGARSNRNAAGATVNQDETQTVYKAVLDVPLRLKAIGGVDLEVGRLPIQFTPYTLKLIDTDAYFYNDKTDLGDIPLDGGKARFAIGPVTATAFAAKANPIQYLSDENGAAFTSSKGAYGLYAGAGHGAYGSGILGSVSGFSPGNRPTGSAIAPGTNGAMSVEQLGGFHANVGTGKLGTIGATYLVASGTSTSQSILAGDLNGSANFDRVFVYGADINTHILGGIGLVGSYTKSDTAGTTAAGVNAAGVATAINLKSSSKITKNNEAYEAGANYNKGKLSLKGGYRYVGPYFGAPGYWDKIGSYTNPTDIKGPFVGGTYNFANNFGLNVEAKFYEGTGKALAAVDGGTGVGGGLLTSDKITNLKAGLRYGLTSASGIDAGIERTEYKIGNSGASVKSGLSGAKPIEYFYNIGYGYSFNPATSFKLLYQIIDFRDKGVVGSTFDPNGSGKGGVAAAQFSVKF